MTDGLQTVLALEHLFEREMIALLLTLPRIYAFLAASQLLAPTSVPRLARSACVLVLAMAAAPINLAHADAFDHAAGTYALLFAKEYLIGFLLGYLVAWIFWTIQAAGSLIDNQRGAAIASSIDPLQGEESTPLGILFSQVYLTYVFTTGGFLLLLGMLYESYQLWPATKGLPIVSDAFPEMMLKLADHAFRLVVVLGGPIVAVMFMAEFALAIVSRFAPQVQVFVLAMPIKSLLGIFMLVFYFAVLLPAANDELRTVDAMIKSLYPLLQFGEEAMRPPPAIPPGGGP